ncbi:LOW QUALITY PROTEIN: superoxide dismutase [Cu-Zn], chloroplastic [Ixodes scapularis]|uniref:LOW QUALITY PROTEIN: superoxide dismutase [Cu-Zn], chloroplastic n=1 Tax=Ixodes scapularis TaxID=6945 RepID=UPI001C390E64|nr:LOW QUALITY PROTEIN: superoxide dismutase [Cu-Zn], chloroplastic [Ixodes scapularis]
MFIALKFYHYMLDSLGSKPNLLGNNIISVKIQKCFEVNATLVDLVYHKVFFTYWLTSELKIKNHEYWKCTKAVQIAYRRGKNLSKNNGCISYSAFSAAFRTPGLDGGRWSVRGGCHLCPQNNKISGIVRFVQTSNWSVEVTVNVTGLPPGSHGFHIHQYGDISKGCASAGGHYNPLFMNHGGPNSSVRHVGDLGNIVANSDGIVVHCRKYHNFTLHGTHSILGRSIIIHADEDDYGIGNHNDSLTTGHVGARLACCSIVVSQ